MELINMVNWFNQSAYKPSTASPLYSSGSVGQSIDASYTVGKDNNGSTIIKIYSNSNVTTLTTGPDETRTLIRLLEATLDEE